ncbi:MAG: hypothetical protein A2Y33_12605 [Spirochaetes bacterium GWF1_51_8]|nr:MAG: hypothetical protein A2Y33_12605 [Spirochaetes bacterium GWF1_51_8]
MIQRFLLTLKEIISQRFISLIVFFSIIVAVFCVGAFQIVGDSFNFYIHEKFATSIPPNFIKVTPKPAGGIGMIQLKKPEGSVLSDTYLAKIQKLGGVKEIHPYMSVQVPVQAIIDLSKLFPLLNIRYRTDLVCVGAPYTMIKNDIAGKANQKKWLDWAPGKPLPMLVPNVLLDAYNQSMADANGLPKIDKNLQKMMIGAHAQIFFGQSSFKTIPGFAVETGELVGFTDNVPSLALVIPLNAARYYNAKFRGKESDKEYIYCFIEVKDHDSVLTVSDKVKSWGFLVETEKSLSLEIQALRDNVNNVIGALQWVILGLSIIAIAFSTVIATLNRTDYYRILRILGASKAFITFTIVIKYALIGYLGSSLGMFLIGTSIDEIAKIMKFTGFELKLITDKAMVDRYIIAGTIIPVISTFPALMKLYFKGLNRD